MDDKTLPFPQFLETLRNNTASDKAQWNCVGHFVSWVVQDLLPAVMIGREFVAEFSDERVNPAMSLRAYNEISEHLEIIAAVLKGKAHTVSLEADDIERIYDRADRGRRMASYCRENVEQRAISVEAQKRLRGKG